MALPTSAEHYELLGELAEGGMATVFVGRLRKTPFARELVAIKSMKQELADDATFAAMFLDEATLTQRIRHPNVVQTLDVASEGGKLLIVMEYVEGITLARLLDLLLARRTSVPPRIVSAIISDLLRGLHAAHELVDGNGRPLHVVHRDVSPQNVLIGTDGVTRILDFGVAKAASQRHVTMKGEIKGKLAYMPPEQAVGEAVDRRADVYSAGVVLWESLVGRRLFTGKTEDEVVKKLFSGSIDPPSMLADEPLSPAVDQLVLRALSQSQEARWPSAKAMADGLVLALPPATAAQVANYIQKTAPQDLADRRRHVAEREARALPLEGESQTLQQILTDRATRSARLGKLPESAISAFGPVPPTPAPQAATPRGASSRKSSRSSMRREHRRKRQRMRILLGFAVAAVVILALMTVALILGRKARESSPSHGVPAQNRTNVLKH